MSKFDHVLIDIFCFFAVSSLGFSLVLNIHFVGFIKLILWTVFVDYVGVGLLIATIFW